MGPQPSSRGNLQTAYPTSPPAVLLQWGRNLPVAEIRASHGLDARGDAGLQWGRNLPVAEISRAPPRAGGGREASMGPQPSSRGNLGRGLRRRLERRGASMGPQPSSRGNFAALGQMAGVSRASMGPQPSSRGNLSSHPWTVIENLPASMGPQPSSRGNLETAVDGDQSASASMGPQPSSRGNWSATPSASARLESFNGAATFQSRKSPRRRILRAQVRASMGPQPSSRGNEYKRARDQVSNAASMGPQPSSRGNAGRVSYNCVPSVLLQWGRNLPVAEIRRRCERREPKYVAFNGAATFQSRKFVLNVHRRLKVGASMGPQPSSRGNFKNKNTAIAFILASMGPQPSSRGNFDCQVLLHDFPLASMGPQPSSRGNRAPYRIGIGHHIGFNGAATFQSRKSR